MNGAARYVKIAGTEGLRQIGRHPCRSDRLTDGGESRANLMTPRRSPRHKKSTLLSTSKRGPITSRWCGHTILCSHISKHMRMDEASALSQHGTGLMDVRLAWWWTWDMSRPARANAADGLYHALKRTMSPDPFVPGAAPSLVFCQQRGQCLGKHLGLPHHPQVVGMAAVDRALGVVAQHALVGEEMQVLHAFGRQLLVDRTQDASLSPWGRRS